MHAALLAASLAMAPGITLGTALAAALLLPTVALAQTTTDWMSTSDPLAARVRPADKATVEQSPPDFGWPDISSDARYQLILTYPDGSRQSRNAPQNWLNWDEVLAPGTYTWQVQLSNSTGTRLSNARQFIVGPESRPFLLPDALTLASRIKAKARPRGLPDNATLASMASQRQAALAELVMDVKGRLTNPLPPDPTTSVNDNAYEACKRALKSLTAYALGKDPVIAADAIRHVVNLASWDPRGATAYAKVDMASRFITWVSALGYDWLGSQMSATQKATVLNTIKLRAGDMHADIIGTRSRIAKYPRDSHGNQTLTMLSVVATLVAGDLPEADAWLAALPQAVNATNPWAGEEGGFANSSTQGVWDIGELLVPWYVTRWSTGIDFAQKPWVRNWSRYLAYFMPPGTPAGLFGDGLEMNQGENRARFAKGYANFAPTPLARWQAAGLSGEDRTRIEYLLSPPADTTAAALPAGTPNAAVLPSIGQVAMHSDLANSNRTSVYFKSAPPPYGAFNHSHADQNGFVVNAGGQRLAIESGWYDDYKTRHWYDWYHQTRSKNAITFDGGQGQVFFEQGEKMGYGVLLNYTNKPELDIVHGDATAAYGGALSKARRSMMYLRPNLILVHDNLASATARQWEWNIHAVNAITAISDTKIRIDNNGQSLCVEMLAGPTMRFTQTNLFTSDPAGGQAPNWTRQWHGKFYSTATAPTAEFIALMNVGCTGAVTSIAGGNGLWTVKVNNQQATISDAGGISVDGSTGVPAAAGQPWTGTPAAVPGVIEAEQFDKGGEGIAYHDNVKGNAGGQYRTGEDVDIVAVTGGYAVNNFETGEWLSYTIKVPASGQYVVELRAATTARDSAFHVELDGANLSGSVPVPKTSGWSDYQPVRTKALAFPAGVHVLKVVSDKQYFNLNSLAITAATGIQAAATLSQPWSGTPVSLPGTIEAEHFDKGGEGVAYHDNVKGNSGAQYRTTEDVDIIVSPDATAGGYTINNFETGEWLAYSVDVPVAGNYLVELRAATNHTQSAFRIEVDGQDVSGRITVPYTADWTAYQWVPAKTIALSAGRHILKVASEQQYFNLDALRASKVP